MHTVVISSNLYTCKHMNMFILVLSWAVVSSGREKLTQGAMNLGDKLINIYIEKHAGINFKSKA